MIKFQGKSVCKGSVIGKIYVYEPQETKIVRYHIDDSGREIERLYEGIKIAVKQLKELEEKTRVEIGEEEAGIFEVHQMMLEDEDYLDSIKNMITSQQINLEFAIASTGDNFAAMFEGMEDAYMQARAVDVKDISKRLIDALNGNYEKTHTLTEPVLLAAQDLTPSETIQMDKKLILGFIIREGSQNSHTAILARTMNIPALIKTDFTNEIHGHIGILDGNTGELIVDPEKDAIDIHKEKLKNEELFKKELSDLKGKITQTKSGKKIALYANIGGLSDVGFVLQNDGEGIGLFRSEFLFLGRNDYPSEEEQFQIYRTVAQNMAGKKVIIRTMDIGADKQVDYFKLDREENPALGYRAIRICLDRRDLFKTQLRAIFRAGAFGKLAIMYPMIISLEEVLEIKKIAAEVEKELLEEKYPLKDIEQGIMIETPAAALISDELSAEVDFFSIGTNDLTQYTLAIDRQNQKLEKLLNPHHRSICKLIEMVVENGHKNNCWVGVCGELASDPEMTEYFLNIGIDELSVAPPQILPLRKKIRELS